MIVAKMEDTYIVRAFAQLDMENIILVISSERLSNVK